MTTIQDAATSLELTVRELGNRFRSGELSPVAVTDAALARIALTEPSLHAFVLVMEQEARMAAGRAEIELRGGQDRGLFQGVPIAVKDIIDIAGLPTRCGSPTRERAAPAGDDASVVARLREAGAVLVGKTVTQEFAAGVVSAPARNPWDPTRIPGGSSGGSAVAVAARVCFAALGSDTGGSIRIPASVTGIVGLKPTYGVIPTGGVFPLSWSLDTVGPLARTVKDAALLFDAMAPDGTATAVPPADGDSLEGLRVGVARPFFFDRLQPGVRRAVDAAIVLLGELGATVVDTPWTEAPAARAVAFLLNRIETTAVHEETLRHHPGDLALLNPDLRLRLQSGALLPATLVYRAQRAREAVKRSMADLFERHRLDALVTPTLPATAIAADRLLITYEDGDEPVTGGYTRLTMPFNATGQPALSLPCGFDDDGLPVGLQLAGRPYQEAALCGIGAAYERAAGWHRQRPPLPS
jgi:aspartyl-tRNA(Asn)/glutamyl-tRNA(Gln) amidotransferase subunit A